MVTYRISQPHLYAGLVIGAAAGAYGMALANFALWSSRAFSFAVVGYAVLHALMYFSFTLPISLLVGLPAFSLLDKRALLNPVTVMAAGLMSGLVIAFAFGGFDNPISLLFYGFGGLLSAGVCSLIIFSRANGTTRMQ